MTDATCPQCDGTGTLAGFVDGFRQGRRYGEFRRDIVCFTCNGFGKIPQQQFNWMEEGRVHMQQRKERGESIFAAAARLGVTVAELNAMEHGRMNPAGLRQDRDDG